MKKIEAILFDYDGTLMDTNKVVLESWQHTFRTLEGRERPEAEIFQTFGEPLRITMKKLFPNGADENAIKVYRSWQRDHFKDYIGLFPGVEEMLRELRKRDVKMGLVTSRMETTTHEGLRNFGIDDCFDTVITADQCSKHKPDPQPINLAVEALHARPENTLMVGDTIFDIDCARNAGVKSALVSWAVAIQHSQLSHDRRPDFYINEPMEIFELIG